MCIILLSSMALFCILFWKKDYIIYHLKIILFIGGTIIATTGHIPFIIFRKSSYRNAIFPSLFMRTALRILGNSYVVRGAENIDASKGGIVLMNHQSLIDLSAMSSIWPIIGNAITVSKKSIAYIMPATLFWGTLFIDRSNRNDALIKLNKQCDAITNNAAKLLIFPEGTRHQGDKLLPFKKGPFHVAIKSQCVIHPVVVSRYTFLDSDKKIFRSGQSIISILPEIDCKGLNTDDVNELLERTQRNMQEEYDRINKEI